MIRLHRYWRGHQVENSDLEFKQNISRTNPRHKLLSHQGILRAINRNDCTVADHTTESGGRELTSTWLFPMFDLNPAGAEKNRVVDKKRAGNQVWALWILFVVLFAAAIVRTSSEVAINIVSTLYFFFRISTHFDSSLACWRLND